MSTKKHILSFIDKLPVEVDIPEVGKALVKKLTAKEFLRIISLAGKDDSEVTLALILFSFVNEAGERIFSDEDKGNIEELPIRIVNALAKAASSVNGLGIEEELKN
jgi:hypothetical protein